MCRKAFIKNISVSIKYWGKIQQACVMFLFMHPSAAYIETWPQSCQYL